MSRELLLYSDFPLGYRNREAEERAARLAARGWRVHYVEQLGIRNPGLGHVGRLARTLARRRSPAPAGQPFDVVSPRLVVPRRAPGIAAINRRWLERQLGAALSAPDRAVIWLRFPTPELVPFVERSRAALVVYEQVDDHEGSPGMTPRLRRLFRDAESRVLARAGLVVVSSTELRDRYAARHANVRLIPAAATDIERFAAAAGATAPEPRTALFTGALDFRFDAELLAATARRLPDWRFVLVGAADEAVAATLRVVANVELPGPVAPDELPRLVARSAVCLIPYRTSRFADALYPLKLGEYLAAGRPVAATPIRTLREFADVAELGGTPEELAAAIGRAADTDSAAARARRVARAAPFAWESRLDEIEAAVAAALASA